MRKKDLNTYYGPIPMKDLLDVYKDCNSFSLSTYYTTFSTEDFNFGLSDSECDDILSDLRRTQDLLTREIFSNGLNNHLNKTEYIEQDEQFYNECALYLNKFKNGMSKKPLDFVLRKEQNKVLLESLLSMRLSFTRGGGTTNLLSVVYTFEVNDSSRKWLLGFENDFDLVELDDLILYKNGKEQYISITHEMYHRNVE